MESLTAQEQKMLKELRAKEARIKRQETEFWKEVFNRKDEVLKRLNEADKPIQNEEPKTTPSWLQQ